MNLLHFAANTPSPPPVMGTAVDRPDLKKCPITLNVGLLDRFSGSADSLVLNFITHGDLVNAAYAKEMIRLGWNPACVKIKPIEAGMDDSQLSLDFIQTSGEQVAKQAKRLTHYVGTFCSAGARCVGDNVAEIVNIKKILVDGMDPLYNLYQHIIEAVSHWPFFIANANPEEAISYGAIQQKSIAIASKKQEHQKTMRQL